MTRIGFRSLLIAIGVCLIAASSANAATRWAAPGGTGPAATCAQANPCGISDALLNANLNTGDEVILKSGTYDLLGGTISIFKGIWLHGEGAPGLTRIVTTGNFGLTISNASAVVSDLEFDQTVSNLWAVSLNNGTMARTVVTSTTGSAVNFSNGVIRDSILVSHRAGGWAVGTNTSGGPYNLTLRNVTAIADGSTNAYGIYAGLNGAGAQIAIDGKSVIARGTTGGVYASASGAGASSSVTLDHSNFHAPFSSSTSGGTATITSTATNNNQSAAPTFLDAAGGDFHQASGSVTKDAGVTDGSSGTTDVDGDARSIGAGPDIGADEYSTATPGVPVITTADNQWSGDTTPDITGTADPGATIHVIVDGNANSAAAGSTLTGPAGSWVFTTKSPLADGSHTFSVFASTPSGVSSAVTASITVKVDATAPVVLVSAPTVNAVTSDATPAFAYSVTETNAGTTSCKVDGGAPYACAASASGSFATLAEGSHTFAVTHVDLASNAATTTVAFKVDLTNPVVSITAPDPGQFTNDTTPHFAITVTDANPGTTACSVDSQASATCGSSGDLSSLVDGEHVLHATHTDLAGNQGTTSVSFTVDATAPVVSFTAPTPNQLTADATPHYALDVVDVNPGPTTCSLDGGAPSPCDSSGDLPALADGHHTLSATHTDLALNSTTTAVAFTVDATPPSVTITAPAAGTTTNDATPHYSLSVVDAHPGSTSCSVDGGAAAACGDSGDLAKMSDGVHTLAVVGTDAAGNHASASVSFTIDATAPNSKITKSPKRKTTTLKAKFKFSSTEPGSSFECKLDRAAFKPCKSPYSKKVKRGKHKLSVRAIDAHGNADASPAVFRWTVSARK